MHMNEALLYTFEVVRGLVQRTVQGLDAQALSWRPDPQANPVGWLVWHLTRVQDAHVSEIVGGEQRWVDGWAERFGFPGDVMDTGYGHSSDEVAAIQPAGPEVLVEYQDQVAQVTKRYLEGCTAGDFDRIIDRSFDPPVSVGVRLISVTSDSLQHLGQAAYVRGLWERNA